MHSHSLLSVSKPFLLVGFDGKADTAQQYSCTKNNNSIFCEAHFLLLVVPLCLSCSLQRVVSACALLSLLVAFQFDVFGGVYVPEQREKAIHSFTSSVKFFFRSFSLCLFICLLCNFFYSNFFLYSFIPNRSFSILREVLFILLSSACC